MITDRPLKLDVTDFGPVARAEVELRPLTVFVGPSNTGKSWLATLAYALHRYFGDSPRGPGPWFWTTPEARLPEDASTDLVRVAQQLTGLPARRTLAHSLEPTSRSAEAAQESVALTPPIEAAIRLHLKEQSAALGKEIERCFGVDSGSNLVRKASSGPARILLRHTVEGVSIPARHELTFGEDQWRFLPTIPSGLRIRSSRHTRLLAELLRNGNEPGSERTSSTWNVIGELARDVLPNHHPAFYLPADRTGLMNAHSTVVSALIQSATMGGIRRADPPPTLSGVRGDFLEQLVEMASNRRQGFRRDRERLQRLGKRLEDGILGGAVKVGGLPGVAYPHFTYRPTGWQSGLPLTNTSSMVSELAPVVLYLRHVVGPDDLLIIDEPESHLHPAMQVAFTRRIAEIAGAGVRIILTTHSEWVIEELGNVVGRSTFVGRTTRTVRDEADSAATSLDARDVGVWLFEPAEDGDGSAVREIALDKDTGLYPTGFDAVATALHNEWAEIASPHGDAE